MNQPNIFRTADRNEWRQWLSENFRTEKEIWLVFPMKAAGEDSISYNDAVEEALCFGWIDSTIRKMDDAHRMQRFTPRKNFGYYSQLNIERLRSLRDEGKIHPSVVEGVSEFINREFVFPEDIMDEIMGNEEAYRNFVGYSDGYKRIRVAYIDAARNRPEEFRKRLDHFVRMCEKGKVIRGQAGAEKYY